MDGGWSHEESPFHEGEQQAQERAGLCDKMEAFARRVVRDHMPEQHRDFYRQLPMLLIGSLDDRGRPWASLLAGRPGFVDSPDPRSLSVAARPLFADPLGGGLTPGREVGVLGIELETRRRNRMAGRIRAAGPDGFTIAVDQAFGNCPQYIQARSVEPLPGIDGPPEARPSRRSDRFDVRAKAIIEAADTLFIATAHGPQEGNQGDGGPTQGADVSHRGGKPGFVRVEDERSLVFPDFSGNFHFNTVGNILVNPKAGFLFADFERGDLLYATGAAEIVWEGPEIAAFTGAERLIRFRAEEVIRVEASLPLRFGFGDYSPLLAGTGDWQEADQRIAAEQDRNSYSTYEVAAVERESAVISSFYLRRSDGRALPTYEPGQFLPIRLRIPGQAEPVTRTYTLSDAPGGEHFRLSIKREGGDALVSTFLHDQVRPGFELEAMAPRGKFVLDRESERPVVLLSGGVGITPMIAMANFLVNEGKRTRRFRRTYFIHGARDGRSHGFRDHIRRLAAQHEAVTAHVRYSAPRSDDWPGEDYDDEGRVDLELLKGLLPFDDYDFYLCGPQAFMQTLYDGLTAMGVREARIHYESFGPASLLKPAAKASAPSGETAEGPVAVRFAESDVEVEWTPEQGTLLDLAEAAGLSPAFACRSGICGTCATRLACGAVDYIEDPSADPGDDQVLICCATPRSVAGEKSCGEDRGVVLEL